MNAETIVKLIEEMVDLKIQQQAATNLKINPDFSRLRAEKRETDRRRLEQIRAELGPPAQRRSHLPSLQYRTRKKALLRVLMGAT